jgi:UDP-2-acetamido-2-deoxy-ribo-hexuluronate aminotransferase
MKPIQMVDLKSQYEEIQEEIQKSLLNVLEETAFINGPQVREFAVSLGEYLQADHVIPCANGTDALQIALMALELEEGTEVLIPSFNYVALAEVTALLKLKPVFVEVDPVYYTIDPLDIEHRIGPRTRVIAPVHLFGQCAPMEEIMAIAEQYNLFVIEDNAQAIGANYTFSDGSTKKAGTIGHIGTTSFFPSKNLGCYGDGGAVFTNDLELGQRIKMIANHGQKVKYIHDVVGVNSRLDTMQAAILNVKIKHLDHYNTERHKVAQFYNESFAKLSDFIITPQTADYSTHVFHQYTMVLKNIDREAFRNYLASKQIPTMVYYPFPIHKQKAYAQNVSLPICEFLAANVVALPISPNMQAEQLNYIVQNVSEYIQSEILQTNQS